jgi:hypothetical protein
VLTPVDFICPLGVLNSVLCLSQLTLLRFYMKKPIEFESGLYYHEVLKANSDGVLFKDSEDRKFFLKQLNRFILPCCKISAYAILGNHAHLLIKPHPIIAQTKSILFTNQKYNIVNTGTLL